MSPTTFSHRDHPELTTRLQTVSACFRPEIRGDIVAQAQTIISDADLQLFVEWWETRRDYHAAVAVEEMTHG